MTLKEMNQIVAEELTHIAAGYKWSPQNMFRMTYRNLRLHSLGKKAVRFKTRTDVLKDAIRISKELHPTFELEYDSVYFGV